MKTVFTFALALAAVAPNWSAEAHSIRDTRDLAENATLAAGAATAGVGTNPLLIKGYRFFDSVTGQYFAIRGIDYYPRPNAGANDANNLDFFTDAFDHVWKRDIPQFQALNANTIRLYAVDPTADHSAFMCALQAAGIYVMVDLGSSCSGCEITADAAPACYPASYRDRGEAIIAQFAQYDNVLGFSAGNEINHRTGGNDWTWNAPCQKKFIRDMRAFIAGCPDMRRVPVGVVMADTNRDDNAQYYNCRTDSGDELENAEWYGINVYVHCDDISDSTKAAGLNLLRDSFKSYKYSIPAILTEFGCLAPSFPTKDGHEAQRTFHDAKFINYRNYSDYFNGGFVFEYSTENANSKSTSAYPFTTYGAQNYGLGYLSPEDCDDTKGGKLCQFERFPNFDNLATAYGAYVATDEPTLSTFNVPADRTNPSKCPANGPLLKTFTWESDKQASKVTCPSKQQSRYQCPAVPLNAILNVTTVSNSVNTNSNASNSTSTVNLAGNAANATTSDMASDHATEDGEALELTDISSSESASKDKATASGSTIRAKSAAASNSISVVMTLVASAVATALMS